MQFDVIKIDPTGRQHHLGTIPAESDTDAVNLAEAKYGQLIPGFRYVAYPTLAEGVGLRFAAAEVKGEHLRELEEVST